MATSLKQAFSGSGGGLIDLADLEPIISDLTLTPDGTRQTFLSASGKFAVSSLGLKTFTTNPVRVEVIVDGQVFLDRVYTSVSEVQSNVPIYGGGTSNITTDLVPFLVKNSLTIMVTGTSGDNQINGGAVLRAIK